MADSTFTIGTIPKNSRSDVVVSIGEFKGHKLADVRVQRRVVCFRPLGNGRHRWRIHRAYRVNSGTDLDCGTIDQVIYPAGPCLRICPPAAAGR